MGTLIDELVTWLAHKFSLPDVTLWGIQFLSTVPERILIFIICSILVAITLAVTRTSSKAWVRYWMPIASVFLPFLALYQLPGRNPYNRPLPQNYGTNVVLILAACMAIIVAPQRRRERVGTAGLAKMGAVRWLLSVILVPFLGAVLLSGWSLHGLARKLHPDKSVQQFDRLNSNGLAIDSENGLLYVSGHGLEGLAAYNVNDLRPGPRESPVGTNWAQSFYFNAAQRELYVFNYHDRALVILNAKTLDLKKYVSGVQVIGGDARIAYDSHEDTIVIAAEGNYWQYSNEPGYPFAVVGRRTAELLYSLKDCDGQCAPGYIDMHPNKPLLYMAFPKKIVAYDMETRKIVAECLVNQWVDGMAITGDGAELLVGAPLRSEVLRFDAQSLKRNGAIPTVFGVRALSIDRERNLLLTASLATNMLDVIDLKTHKSIERHYVAPWLRSICPDPNAGIAYVSSALGLFKVRYTDQLHF